MSILGRSPRKSVTQESIQAYIAYGPQPAATLEARTQSLWTEPVRNGRVRVVEVVQERIEERVAVGDDRLLDPFEDVPWNSLRVVAGLKDVRRDRADQDGLADPG